MATYTPSRFALPNGLDERGLMLGLQRLDNESLATYRRRLLLEARDPSGSSQVDYIRTLNRKVGQFDQPMFDVDVIRDANGDPLAPDPYIEITSTHIRVYSDWTNSTLDFELNLHERSGAGTAYFLREVDIALTASTFFSHTVLDTTFTFKKSDHLKFGNSELYVVGKALRESQSNRLEHGLIRDIYPLSFVIFQNEVATPALVVEQGDFYVDYINGAIITYETAKGLVSYIYKVFPYRLYWQAVRAVPYNDADKVYSHKDTILSDDTGLPVHKVLNSEGAKIANSILNVHSLGWGE
jgi:hypothetical protein